MKKKVLVLIAFLFSSLPSQLSIINCQFSIVNALPAQRGVKRTVPQADGTKLTLNLRGDEHLHYFTADNGLPVVRNAKGNYCYAEVKAEGLVPTSQLVAQSDGPVSRIANATPARLSQVQQALRLLRQQRMKNVERTPMPRRVMTGQRRGLVILAEYANYPYTYSKATMDSIMNYTGYQKGYFQGSVHDYFLEQSNGQFDLTFDVVGPVKLSKDMEYYGQNNIFADTGDCSVEYRADTKLYIERLTAPDSADMIADSNIVSGQYFMVSNALYKATTNIANGGQIIVGTNCTKVSLATALNEINA